MLSDDNGCMCSAARASASRNGNPMPADWLCIACRSRAESKKEGHVCRDCGIGLMAGAERDTKMCSNCFYERGDL